MNHQEGLTAYLHSFVSQLASSGVENAVISPGSRSTPIALLIAEQKEINIHVHVDERSASFFALGMAKATKKPVVLVCTSGTAAANYYPAIIEANISRIPLIVLTADRPHELRDVGAPQAIDQIQLYGNHVKYFVEMAIPEGKKDIQNYAKVIAARSTAKATQHPFGPVHINMPIREPLIPDFQLIPSYQASWNDEKELMIENGESIISISTFQKIAKKLQNSQNGIIICGELDNITFTNIVISFAERLGYPIIADPLSQLRSETADCYPIIDTYDAFLRHPSIKQKLKPDIIIRFGSMPISKSLTIFLRENSDIEQIVVDSGEGFRDPNLLTTTMLYCNEVYFCEQLLALLPLCSSSHHEMKKWIDLNDRTKQVLSDAEKSEELTEATLFYQLGELLPEKAILFVGNSMPIRDLDTFFHKHNKNIKIVANRGANGIDGTVSTALGYGSVNQIPLFLIVGDLTFFHDLNGLLLSKQYDIPITVLLINNNGGGIFSFLPQADHEKHFEELFGTPLHIDFQYAVKMFEGEYALIENWTELRTRMKETVFNKGRRVWEIKTNREKNVLEHRRIMTNISREIDYFLKDNVNENTGRFN